MLVTLCRRVLRVDRRLLRFYAVHVESLEEKLRLENEDHGAMDQSFDLTRVRRDTDKSLRIAILGLPNAGKSTLVNQLAKRQICAMSGKAHTTREKSNVIYSENNTQLILIDTPGLVTNRDWKKFHLEVSFKRDIDKSLACADLVAVVHDAARPFQSTKIDNRIIEALKHTPVGVTSVLVLNKVDRIKQKKKLLDMVNKLTSENSWPNFSDVFMISALKDDGVDDLRNYLLESAKERDWDYTPDTITDDPPERIVERTVKAKFMDILPQELPYLLKINTEHVATLSDGTLSAVVAVMCPSQRISKLAMGVKGGRVKEVARMAEQELSNAFRTNVMVKIAINFPDDKAEKTKKSFKH